MRQATLFPATQRNWIPIRVLDPKPYVELSETTAFNPIIAGGTERLVKARMSLLFSVPT
jgi:hypothetical protein